MNRLAILTGCIFAFNFLTHAQTPAEFQGKIKSQISDRAYLPAVDTLREFRAKDLIAFEANNYDYLLGRLAEKTGDFAQAMTSYQSVASRGSVLEPYAKWHLSQIARSTGNLMLERLYLQEIVAGYPDMLLSSAARKRVARSFSESKNYNEAIKLLTIPSPALLSIPGSPVQKGVDNGFARENLVLLADAYLNSGKSSEARDIYNKLLNEMPNAAQPDDFALAAAKGLDLLDVGAGNTGKSVAKLLDTEHLRRASIYQFNRDFDDARLHYKAIIDTYPDSGIVPDAIFQIGRGYSQLGEFVDALQWFERVQEQFPDHPVAKDALLQAASCYAKTGKFKEAIVRYRKFIDLYPADERLDRAYLNIVDAYRDQGSDQDALKWAATTEQVFKGKPPEAIAIFTQARIYLAGSDWSNALTTLDRLKGYSDLGGTKVPGGTNTAEAAFLRAFSLEQLQRYDEAIDTYLSIPDGRSEYYGARATERLMILAGSDPAKSAVEKRIAMLAVDAKSKDAETSRKALQSLLRLTTTREEREKFLDSLRYVYKNLAAYQNLPSFKMMEVGRRELRKEPGATLLGNEHQQIADELLFLGLYDEAAPEFEASQSPPDVAKAGDLGYTIAVLYQRGDTANRAVAFAEPLWRNVPADYQIELISRDQLEMLYPAPYVDSLLRYAAPRDVDPRFVLSIMRQESRYRAQVKSYAAARGLMQFISGTSDKIASELGKPNFRQDELYDPPTAILFGSQYFADLFQEFPQQPAAVAASYNGGDDNMKRWIARSKSNLPDRYVPEIIFSQSKDYVYKVMGTYRIYQMIYDENLRLK